MRRLLSIDPGYAAMGWVLWKEPTKIDTWYVEDAGVLKPRSVAEILNSFDAVNDMISQLENRFHYMRPNVLICEEPQIMGGPGGYAAARTSVLGLAAAAGAWSAWIHLNRGQFVPAPVVQWKGQLSKQTVNKRIKSVLSPKELKLLTQPASHDWDAAGIGLWYQGRF